MRDKHGPLTELGDKEGAEEGAENDRVKRYIVQYTINP